MLLVCVGVAVEWSIIKKKKRQPCSWWASGSFQVRGNPDAALKSLAVSLGEHMCVLVLRASPWTGLLSRRLTALPLGSCVVFLKNCYLNPTHMLWEFQCSPTLKKMWHYSFFLLFLAILLGRMYFTVFFSLWWQCIQSRKLTTLSIFKCKVQWQ